MRVAVCIFGQLRGDTETFSSIRKHLILPNNADVFVHSWNYYDGKVYEPKVLDETLIDFKISPDPNLAKRKKANLSNVSDLISIMRPKRFVLDEQEVFDATSYVELEPQNLSGDGRKSDINLCTAEEISHYQRVKSQWLSKLRCYKLLESPKDYDVIFMLRNDLVMVEDFICNNVENGIYADGDYNRIYDQYYFGNPDSMSDICSAYNNLDYILKNHNRGLSVASAEFHLSSHLKLSNVFIHNTGLLRYFLHSGDGRYHVGIKY